jgi:4-hydroxy-3-polyprenylbenzoate decarboxylase
MVLPVEGVFHNLVIVKISKEYPGQASKVMHSLWGAGQMMFTKMMIIVDGDVNIHDSIEVAKYISKNFDPQTDLYFTQGPVDVLDHSCSVMAFGGKMGIDATRKLPEEKIISTTSIPEDSIINEKELLLAFPEIKAINTSLLADSISLVIISIEKNRKDHVRQAAEKLFARKEFQNVKVLLFVEGTVDALDIPDSIWRFANNIDPKRDHYIIQGEKSSHVVFDGTRKTKQFDGFQRDWPNILVSDDATIKKIDSIWSQLNLGPFIPSPSLKYKKQMYGYGAVVSD